MRRKKEQTAHYTKRTVSSDPRLLLTVCFAQVTLDDGFLDYLASDGVVVELWAQRHGATAVRVASAKLPLAPLLAQTDGRLAGSLTLHVRSNVMTMVFVLRRGRGRRER